MTETGVEQSRADLELLASWVMLWFASVAGTGWCDFGTSEHQRGRGVRHGTDGEAGRNPSRACAAHRTSRHKSRGEEVFGCKEDI